MGTSADAGDAPAGPSPAPYLPEPTGPSPVGITSAHLTDTMTGWKRWLVVTGAVHASFTDLALLADQAGIEIDAHLPGARSLDIGRWPRSGLHAAPGCTRRCRPWRPAARTR